MGTRKPVCSARGCPILVLAEPQLPSPVIDALTSSPLPPRVPRDDQLPLLSLVFVFDLKPDALISKEREGPAWLASVPPGSPAEMIDDSQARLAED